MAAETAEAPMAARRLVEARDRFAEAARRIDLQAAPLAVICGRGSSGHAGVHLRYLIETRLGLAVSATAPSVTTALGRSLRLKDALFVTISQSGRSPDLVAATVAARQAGAVTVALVNDEASPLAAAAEIALPLMAGPERSVAATKTVVASMTAGALLVAALSGDEALRAALDRLPDRLEAALGCDWSEFAECLGRARAAYATSRGFGLGPAREVALKMSETIAMPALGYSAAELLHGPRAAVSAATPVLALRLGDRTGEDVGRLAGDLKAAGVPVGLCGEGGDLGWIGDDHPVTDAIAMLPPAYRMIEAAARAAGRDPDRPPHLSKVTSTL